VNSVSSSNHKEEKYPNIFNHFKIGPIDLPNRLVFPAWALNYANTDGTVSDKLVKFYTDLAKGGCGLIFTGAATVSSDGIPFDRVMKVDSDAAVPGLKRLYSAIKEAGGVPGVQIVHYGRQSSTSVSGDVLIAPSAIPCPIMSQYDPEYKVKEMSIEEIENIKEAFISAALRCAGAGAEVIQVHACHGYLLNEFLSPYSNVRTDRYGGSLENRTRLVTEIISAIHEKIGDKAAIALRISGDEFVEGGLVPMDYKEMLPLFEKAGLHMLDVAAGVYESMERIVPPAGLGIAPHADIPEQIKSFSQVPVCAVGSILDLETAEFFIASGKSDLCAMGRAQMADPDIIAKSKEGREKDVRQCLHCNNCTFWTTGDPEVYCAVNPDYRKPN